MLRNLIRTTVAIAKKAWAPDLRPPSELLLFKFCDRSALDKWESSSDAKYGGLSTCNFDPSGSTAIFHGYLSVDFNPDKIAFIKKSGFAGIRTKKGFGIFDLQPFDTIEFRLKGDGRTYVTSLRTENWVDNMTDQDDNTWQAFIHTKENEWRVYKVLLKDYRKTWQGKFVAVDCKLNPRRIVGMGFHVGARTEFGKVQANGPGAFKLEVDWIKGVRTGVGYDATKF